MRTSHPCLACFGQDAGGRLTVVPHFVGIGAQPLEATLARAADPHGLLVAVAQGLEESGHDPADLTSEGSTGGVSPLGASAATDAALQPDYRQKSGRSGEPEQSIPPPRRGSPRRTASRQSVVGRGIGPLPLSWTMVEV